MFHSDRDSMAQVRVPFNGLLSMLQQLVKETLSWETVMSKYVVVCTGESEGLEEELAAGNAAVAATAVITNTIATADKAYVPSSDPSISASAAVSTKSQASETPVAPVVIQYTTRGSFSRPNTVQCEVKFGGKNKGNVNGVVYCLVDANAVAVSKL